MKKILALLFSVTLVSSPPLIVWGEISSNLREFDIKIANSTYINNEKALGDINETDISYFFGDTIFNYANYKLNNDKILFNGNLDSLLKTRTKYKTISLWNNDFASEQLVLTKSENLRVQNITIDVKDGDKNGPEVILKRMNFIKSTKNKGTKFIENGTSFYPDELVDANLENMDTFPVQPFLIQVSTKDKIVKSGTYNYKIRIQYELNGVFRTKLIPIDIKVDGRTLNTEENKKSENQRFSYDGMTSPTNFYKYGIQELTKNEVQNKEIRNQKPDYIPLIFTNNSYYFNWMKFNSKYKPYFLNSEYREMVKNNYQILQYMNLQYGYASAFGNSFIRIYATNEAKYQSDDEYWLDIAKPTEDILNNKNIKWAFDFAGLDAYISFLTEIGISKIYIPVIPRGEDAIKFYYFFKDYGIDTDEFAPVSALKNLIIDGSGSLTDAGNLYKNTIFRQMITALSNHIREMQNDSTYQTKDGTKMQFYYSFDETEYEIDKAFQQEVVGNDEVEASDKNHLLKSHAYIGWQYDDNFENDKEKINSLIEGDFDDVTLQQREFIEEYFQTSEESDLRNALEERNKLRQVTKIYSSWNNFPAPYIASNPADAAWGPLLSYRLGVNGFTRFAFEGYRNNVSLISEDNSTLHEPGDAYLLYPGTGNGENWSIRLENAFESYEMVVKLRQLYPNGIDNYNESGDTNSSSFLEEISKTTDATRTTNYQWDLNYYESHALQFENGESVSLQIEKIKNFLLKK